MFQFQIKGIGLTTLTINMLESCIGVLDQHAREEPTIRVAGQYRVSMVVLVVINNVLKAQKDHYVARAWMVLCIIQRSTRARLVLRIGFMLC